MIITKVIIDNFKVYKHQEFEFGDNKLILVTGPNGFGKTTLIDAIEWCLSGDIARVKKCYDQRNSNQSEKERVENRKGIIKNSDCNPNDKIRVTLSIQVDNFEVVVYREQKEDSIYVNTELIFANEVPENIKDKIENFAANNKFYNYHVCDTYKSYEFMNTKRQEVKEQFEDFIKPHPIADNFSKKLKQIQEELKNEIQIKEKNLIKESLIEDEKKSLDLLKAELKKIDYPQISFYEGEILGIEREKQEKIVEQQEKIEKCGYNVAAIKIEHIISYYQDKENAEEIKKLVEIADSIEDDLNIAIKNSYYDSERLVEINNKLKIISDEKQKIENAKKISEIDTILLPEVYSELKEYINLHKNEFTKAKAEIDKKQGEINDKEKGNEIIAALSNLVVGREGILKYKDLGNNRCPLCGSDEKFKKITQSSELAVEAQYYLNKTASDLAILKKAKQDIVDDVNNKFDNLKKYIIRHFDEKLKELEDKKTVFTTYYIKTKDFFGELRKLNIPVEPNCIENIRKNHVILAQKLLSIDIVNSEIELLKNILTAVQYSFDFINITVEALKKMQLDIRQLCDQSISVVNFAFDEFNKKLLFINNIINNQKILEKQLQIEKYEKSNKKIIDDISKLNKAIDKAKEIHDSIEGKKRDIEKLELEAVGPYLYKIFSKVIKHSIVEEFKFNRDGSKVEGGATFTDQKGNNILNILSQGQFGVFMLSFFFANMFKRRDETEFKTYFVDDITSCMDDMNVLSFTDIVKYQLYENNGVIKQFFFSTCNEDLEKLFIHKMKSFGIKFINLKLKSYAKGEIQNSQGQLVHF